MSTVSLVRFKCCTKCGCTKPLSFYVRDRSTPTGRKAACRVCSNLMTKRWRAKNAGHLARYRRARYLAHKEEENTWNRAYHAANREYIIDRLRQYREANREYFRQWKKANLEKQRQYKQDRQARLANAEGSHSQAEVWQMLEDQQHLCAFCETPLMGKFHVDHLTPLRRGGSDSWQNLAISCPSCNTSKGRKTAEEFMEYIRQTIRIPDSRSQ